MTNASAGAPVRILNVNDSASNRYYVSRVLRAAGWEVLEAGTGADGLDMARVERPNVVVLDVKLPDMSGLEVCRMLRADPATANVIVIQTSATFVTSEGKARGLESGADQYLTQPFESVELVAMVKNLLRLREKEAESRTRAAALVEADRRKDEFLAMLAHELRNPLSAISTAAALLQHSNLDDRAARINATIDRQARHLARLVDDLLDVSRITRGKIQLRPQALDLGNTLKQFVDVEARTMARQHDLSLHVSDEPMWANVDPTRLDQILFNLIGNAAKYTEAGGKIAVSLTPHRRGDKRYALLKIRDTGRGIAQENLSSVFDLFFQVDNSLARSQSGLGVGLTMVKRLLEMQGGTIVAHSDGLGRGAEFRVELPLVEAVAQQAQPEAAGSPRQLSVLLVDDNVDSCGLYEMSFQEMGHRVQTANDGIRGLELALSHDYDLAIIDIGLPGVDGYEIARRVREARGEHSPLMLALTGYGREEDRARALAAGFDAHLVKPMRVDDVHAIITRLLAEKRRFRRESGSEKRTA